MGEMEYGDVFMENLGSLAKGKVKLSENQLSFKNRFSLSSI